MAIQTYSNTPFVQLWDRLAQAAGGQDKLNQISLIEGNARAFSIACRQGTDKTSKVWRTTKGQVIFWLNYENKVKYREFALKRTDADGWKIFYTDTTFCKTEKGFKELFGLKIFPSVLSTSAFSFYACGKTVTYTSEKGDLEIVIQKIIDSFEEFSTGKEKIAPVLQKKRPVFCCEGIERVWETIVDWFEHIWNVVSRFFERIWAAVSHFFKKSFPCFYRDRP